MTNYARKKQHVIIPGPGNAPRRDKSNGKCTVGEANGLASSAEGDAAGASRRREIITRGSSKTVVREKRGELCRAGFAAKEGARVLHVISPSN